MFCRFRTDEHSDIEVRFHRLATRRHAPTVVEVVPVDGERWIGHFAAGGLGGITGVYATPAPRQLCAYRVTDPADVARAAKGWADGGWPAESDTSGTGITAPFNAPAQGPPPWHVYRIEPRTATVVLGVEPGGLTRFKF